MRQREYVRLCNTMAYLTERVYYQLDKHNIKGHKKLLRYARLFRELAKIKIRGRS